MHLGLLEDVVDDVSRALHERHVLGLEGGERIGASVLLRASVQEAGQLCIGERHTAL